MYLSKLSVDVGSREFRRDRADLHEMHRTLLNALPDVAGPVAPRQHYDLLWRLEEAAVGPMLLVQSNTHPDWSSLPPGYLADRGQVRSLRPALAAITPGRRLRFRIVANTTYALAGPRDADGRSPRGKRTALRRTEDQIAWLLRQGERHGFSIPAGEHGPDVAVSSAREDGGWKREGRSGKRHKITMLRVQFDGRLLVTDDEALRKAVLSGIGRGRAYGCGLLSLAAC